MFCDGKGKNRDISFLGKDWLRKPESRSRDWFALSPWCWLTSARGTKLSQSSEPGGSEPPFWPRKCPGRLQKIQGQTDKNLWAKWKSVFRANNWPFKLRFGLWSAVELTVYSFFSAVYLQLGKIMKDTKKGTFLVKTARTTRFDLALGLHACVHMCTYIGGYIPSSDFLPVINFTWD